MPTATDNRLASTGPPTCEVRGWPVFVNGHHKPSEFYSPADVAQIAANYETLRGHLTPTAGLGHDLKQRLTASIGLPNVGRLTEAGDVRADDAGTLYLTVRNVPAWLGGMINAGRYPAGSVELKRDVPDPTDPAKRLPGSVLTAVAFLGEEEPAVKGCPPPRAVFADGTEVPPNHDPLPVSADVVRSSVPPESRLSAARLCFSGAALMTPDEIKAKLKSEYGLSPEVVDGLDDDEAQKLWQSMEDSDGQFSSRMKSKFGAGDGSRNQTGQQEAMNAKDSVQKDEDGDIIDYRRRSVNHSAGDKSDDEARFAAFAKRCFADAVAPLVQRMGAVEQAVSDQQKAVSGQLSTMSAVTDRMKAEHKADVEAAVDQAIRDMKIMPADKARFVKEGLACNTASTFSDGPHKGKTEYQAWKADLAARPRSLFAAPVIPDAVGDGKRNGLPSTAAGLIRHLELDSGRAAANLTKRVAV